MRKSIKEDKIFHRQLGQALLISWWIVSLPFLTAIILPFLVEPSALTGLYPPCSSISQSGEPCVLCGMTRAFYSISSGHWAEAREYNSCSSFVYGAFLLNSGIFILFSGRYILQLVRKRAGVQLVDQAGPMRKRRP